jgi:hypothetical protein
VLDAQPVGVGCDHRQPLLLCLQQNAGEDRPDLVAGSGTGHALDRLGERRTGQLDRLALELRQAREVLGRKRPQVKPRAAGGELDVALLRALLERHLPRRQVANDVDQQPPG